jgi:hypothetical protein
MTTFEVAPPGFTTVMDALPLAAIRFAGTEAQTCVVLSVVVVSAEPFQLSVAPAVKLVPLAHNVKAGPVATAEVGVRLVITGPAALMGNAEALDAAPPGFTTVTLALPCNAIRSAVTAAVNCEPLTNVVEIALPFQSTVAPERNPVPFTVRVKAAPPAVAEVGLRLVIAGVAALIVKVAAADELAPGFVTTTLAVPAAAIRLAGTAAVSCVALTNVVASAVPFQPTAAPDTNPVPLTVSVKAGLVAVADDGLKLVIAGGGPPLLIVNVDALDVTPAFTTETLAVPAVAIRLAGTAAVNCVALTNVVVNAVMFQYTAELETNPVPVTVSENAAPPAAADDGFRPVITGGGVAAAETV